MPRSGGNYTLPEAPFTPNTPISSAAVNSDLSDIADALTASLARDGQGGMTAVLPLANTGFSYLADPNTGMRRTAADTQAISAGGVDTLTITNAGASIAGTFAVSGAFTVGGSPLLLIGEIKIWPSATIPAKWLLMDGSSLLRVTYPDLWTFAAAEIAAGNTLFTNGNGTTTFTVGTMVGYAPVGMDAAGTTLGGVTHIGDTTGNKAITLAANQIPSITSTTAALSVAAPSSAPIPIATAGSTIGTGLLTSGAGGGPLVPVPDLAVGLSWSGVTSLAGSGVGATSNNTGSTVTPIVQPSRAFKFIIYAGA